MSESVSMIVSDLLKMRNKALIPRNRALMQQNRTLLLRDWAR